MCPLSQKHRLDIAQVVAVFEEAGACHLHKRHLSCYNVFQQEANQRTSQAHEKPMANKGAKVAPQAPQSDVQNAILAAAAAGAAFATTLPSSLLCNKMYHQRRLVALPPSIAMHARQTLVIKCS